MNKIMIAVFATFALSASADEYIEVEGVCSEFVTCVEQCQDSCTATPPVPTATEAVPSEPAKKPVKKAVKASVTKPKPALVPVDDLAPPPPEPVLDSTPPPSFSVSFEERSDAVSPPTDPTVRHVHSVHLKSDSVVRLGGEVGAVALKAADTTAYTAISVGPKLTLAVVEGLRLDVGGGLSLAVNNLPIGAYARTGVAIALPEDFSLLTGVRMDAGALDATLEAKSIFLTGSVGLEKVLTPNIAIGVSALLGAEYDAKWPSFAGGVAAHVAILTE